MNDKGYEQRIRAARRELFKKGKKISSKSISDLLSDESLTPTQVSFEVVHHTVADIDIIRMHFLHVSHWRTLASIFSFYLL